MEALKALMRIVSYLFHALLALFLIALATVALLSGVQNVNLGILPWTGPTLVNILLIAGILGLVSLLLAIRGKFSFLFLLWSLAVAFFVIKGYVFSTYRFAGGFGAASYLVPGSLIGILGAWFQFRRQPGRARRH